MAQINYKLMAFISSPDFSDNSRGLWEYVERETDFETYWVVRDVKTLGRMRARGIACGLDGSEEANEKLQTARFLLTSSFDWAYTPNREQIHIALWHGFPLKLIGFFESAAAEQNNFEELKVWTTRTDMILACSRFSQLTMSGMFAVDPRKVKACGFPRNDLMFTSDAKKELAKILDIDTENSRLFFYLPTMRKGLKAEGENFSDNFFNYADYNADEIDAFLEEQNAYIVAKVHFADNEMYSSDDFVLPKRLILLNTEKLNEQLLTIYHIMNAFDGLITDYSSVYADFLMLDKPVLFSCPDIEKYRNDRGFVVDDPALLMPGSIVKNQKELLDEMKKSLEIPKYGKEKRDAAIGFFHSHLDAESAKRVVEELRTMDENWKEDPAKLMAREFGNPLSPLASYNRDIRAEIFFDTGNSFNEAEKIRQTVELGENGEVTLIIDCPENTKALRVDPEDYPRWGLEDMQVIANGKEIPYGIVNGIETERKIYFYHDDPQIIIPLPEKASQVIVSFDCFSLQKESGAQIHRQLEQIQNLHAELDMEKQRTAAARRSLNASQQDLAKVNQAVEVMKNSSSWKLTKPIRSIGDLARKGKSSMNRRKKK